MEKIVVLTGIYPPQSGGPAKFASTFPEWVIANYDKDVVVITYVNNLSNQAFGEKYKRIEINKNVNIICRFYKSIKEIYKQNSEETIFIANGLFLEILFASLICKIKYIAKVPGDIVWERMRNAGQTKLSFEDFQTSKINLKSKIIKWLFIKSLARSSKIISPTVRFSKTIEEWNISNRNIVVIPNGVDTDFFKPASTAKTIDILVVNRLVTWKKVDSILRVAAKMNLNVTIAGNGPEMNNLVKLAKKIDCNACFLGDIPPSELIKLYQSARLYILYSDFELTAYSLIEAQLSGLFAIANRNTGSSEVINDGITGILIDGNSEIELESAIQEFIHHYESKISPSRISNACAQKFDNRYIFSQVFKLAQEL